MSETQHVKLPDGASDVAALDLSMFTPADILNVILQRSEILHDQPGGQGIVRSWCKGDDRPAMATVERLGPELVRRAVACVHAEYLLLREDLRWLRPLRLADIGCGYGFFDLFAHRDLDCDLALIDLEQNGRRHFRYRPEAAAYSSLEMARQFLEANGCDGGRICTVNPERQPLAAVGGVDLAVSFLACGFHFPWQAYKDFFLNSVVPGGSILLDLRTRTADQAMRDLASMGRLSGIGKSASGKARRVHLVKSGVRRGLTPDSGQDLLPVTAA